MSNKKLLLFVAVLFGMVFQAGQAFALLTPANPVTSPIITPTAGNSYYYVFRPHTSSTPHIYVDKVVLNLGSAPTIQEKFATINPQGIPYGMVVSPDGKRLYAALSSSPSSKITVYDLSQTGFPGTDIPSTPATLQEPRQMAVTPDGKYLYVADAFSHMVHVVDVSKTSIASATYYDVIDTGQYAMYGMSIKGDGSRLAISVNQTYPNGKVLIYDISDKTVGKTKLIHTISNLTSPSYVKFAPYPDSVIEMLYVKVQEKSGDYADVRSYYTLEGPLFTPYMESSVLRIDDVNDEDPINAWEGMDVSPDGRFIYVNHWHTDSNPSKTGVYSYVFRAAAIGSGVVEFNTAIGWSNGQQLYISHADSVILGRGGETLWFAYSNQGAYDYINSGTGYYDQNTGILNMTPGKPAITYPVTGYNDISGSATWKAAFDENPSALKYEVYYLENIAGNSNWILYTTTGAGVLSAPLNPSTFISGKSYYLKVRAFDGTNRGEFDSVGPFTMKAGIAGNPKITALYHKTGTGYDASPTTEAYVYDTIKIVGTGFGTVADGSRSTAANNVKVGGLKIRDSVDQAGVVNNGLQVYSWATDSNTGVSAIEIGIPRKATEEATGLVQFVNSGANDVVVTAGGQASAKVVLNIKPTIWGVEPSSGSTGSTVVIKGTALESVSGGTRDIKFGSVSAGAGAIVRESGLDPDGVSYLDLSGNTTGNDVVTISVPSGLASGICNVSALVNSMASNNDKTFTVTATAISTVEVKHGSGSYVATDEAFVYDTVKISGSGFGTSGQITLGKVIIPSSKIYSWSDSAIEFGIPRSDESGVNFVEAGAVKISIETLSGTLGTGLKIKPAITGVSPASGAPGSTVTLYGTSFGSGKTITAFFDGIDIPAQTVRTGTIDTAMFAVPISAALGSKNIYAVVNSLNSNSVTFEVTAAGAPAVSQIIPNAAPNSADITVEMNGLNFMTGTTVMLKMSGQTDITGKVTYDKTTKIKAALPIKGKTIGKWDVVVSNPGGSSVTVKNGFTILDGTGEASQIIDDFEGTAVAYPSGYQSQGLIDFQTTTDKYEGVYAGNVTFETTASGYRGYYAALSTEQDISSFKTVTLMIKVDKASANNTLKLQLTAKSADGQQTKSFAIPTPYIALSDSSYSKKTFNTKDFVEVDSQGNAIAGGASLDSYKSRIIGYLAGFTGNDASSGAVKIDFIAAGGYTPTKEAAGPIATYIKRDGVTANSSTVTITWEATDPVNNPVTSVDIYASSKYSTTEADWGSPISSGNSTSTYTPGNTYVGDGKNMFYKVVPAGQSLTSSSLTSDVVGKFDLKASATTAYNLVSVPLVQPDAALSLDSIIGNQMTSNAYEFAADSIYYPDGKGGFDIAWLKDDGKWYIAGTTDQSSTIEVSITSGMYLYVNTGNSDKNITIVGKINESSSSQTISQGFNLVGTPYPLDVELTASGLKESGLPAGSLEFSASSIYSPKSDGTYDIAWLKDDGKWYDAGGATVTTIKLKPGVGYYVYDTDVNNQNTSFTWTYPRPY